MAAGKLQTQTETFWRDDYEVSQGDLDLIAGLILEAGRPQPTSSLASAIIRRRFQREKDAASQLVKTGQVYQPKESYEVGQTLVFTARDLATGRVLDVRPGHNPKYGAFEVIRVAFDDDESEFAASLQEPRLPLNRPADELLGTSDDSVSESDLLEAYSGYVERRVDAKLEQSVDFVQFDGTWFLRELLPDMHIGYLNLAEAMIYEAGHPLAAQEMLKDLDLDVRGSREAELFALNRALGGDERFDNVGTTEKPIWYLRALEPDAAFVRPAVLRPAFRAQGEEYLGLTMLDYVEEIGDELDDINDESPSEIASFPFQLSFPHLYAGTIPLLHGLRNMLPDDGRSRFPITMVDSRNDERFDVWVVLEERYVAGFDDWYKATGMCVGGEIELIPTEEPLTFTLSIAPLPARSRKTDWTRTATVVDGDLVLQVTRSSLDVRCDRNMVIDVPDREAIADLMARAEEGRFSLSTITSSVFDELAKLSNRGLVHAKSLYSAVNLVRRMGAVPLFAELTRRACFDPVGDGYWAFDAALQKVIYQTPDEMRERPHSTRTDTVKDPVVQYLGR